LPLECVTDRRAVGDHGGVARGRARLKDRKSATCPADCAATVGKGSIARGGCVHKYYDAEFVIKGSIACGRAALEQDLDVIGDGGIACRRGSAEFQAGIVGEAGITRGRAVAESYVASVSEVRQTSRRRVVQEIYHGRTRDKVLGDPRIVRDAHAVDGEREEGAGNRERARARVEHDAVDLRSLRDDGASYVGARERCRVRRPIGRAIGNPVGRGVPVRIGRSYLPGGAPGKAARCCKQERQNGRGQGKERPLNGAQG